MHVFIVCDVKVSLPVNLVLKNNVVLGKFHGKNV